MEVIDAVIAGYVVNSWTAARARMFSISRWMTSSQLLAEFIYSPPKVSDLTFKAVHP